MWLPPPQDRANGRILYYKLYFVEDGRNFEESDSIQIWNITEFLLDELRPFQKYKISVLAGTSVGDGPVSMQSKKHFLREIIVIIKVVFLS